MRNIQTNVAKIKTHFMCNKSFWKIVPFNR